MDFTYIIAGFLAIVVGFAAGCVFVAFKGKSSLRLFAVASATAFALDWLLLINWAHVGEVPVIILVSDFAFFAIYSLIGCLIGASPPLLVRYIWRVWSRRLKNDN